MKFLYITASLTAAGIICIATDASFAAIRENDRLQAISGSAFLERSLGTASEVVLESGSAEPEKTDAAPESTAAPAEEKPAPKAVTEERPKRSYDGEESVRRKKESPVYDEERPRKRVESEGKTETKKVEFESLVSTAPAASIETATEQTGMEDLVYEDPASKQKPNVFLAILRVVISLLVVAGCIVLAGFGLKKFMEKRSTPLTFKQPLVNVLSHTYLGPRKMLYIVEVMGKILVLGVTDGNIQLLSEMDPAVLEKALKEKKLEPPQPAPLQDPGFKGYLAAVMERFK